MNVGVMKDYKLKLRNLNVVYYKKFTRLGLAIAGKSATNFFSSSFQLSKSVYFRLQITMSFL